MPVRLQIRMHGLKVENCMVEKVSEEIAVKTTARKEFVYLLCKERRDRGCQQDMQKMLRKVGTMQICDGVVYLQVAKDGEEFSRKHVCQRWSNISFG